MVGTGSPVSPPPPPITQDLNLLGSSFYYSLVEFPSQDGGGGAGNDEGRGRISLLFKEAMLHLKAELQSVECRCRTDPETFTQWTEQHGHISCTAHPRQGAFYKSHTQTELATGPQSRHSLKEASFQLLSLRRTAPVLEPGA